MNTAIVNAAAAIAVTDSKVTFAHNLGAKLGEGFTAIAGKAADAKEVTNQAALDMLQFLYSNLSDEELARVPVPGTPFSGPDGKEIPCNNPDKFKVPTKNKDGLTVMQSTTFMSELYKGTPWAIDCQSHLTYISEATKDGGKAPADYMRMSVGERKSAKDYWAQRYNVGKSTLVRAVRLFHKWNELEACPHVNVSWLMTGKGEDAVIRNTPKPIMIQDKSDVSVFDYFSVSSFIALDIAKAGGMAATFESIKLSQQRDMDKDKDRANGSASKPELIDTFDKFEARLTDLHSYLDAGWDAKTKDGLYNQLLAKLNKEGSEELLLSIFDIHKMFGDITSKPAFINKWGDLQEKMAEADKAVAA